MATRIYAAGTATTIIAGIIAIAGCIHTHSQPAPLPAPAPTITRFPTPPPPTYFCAPTGPYGHRRASRDAFCYVHARAVTHSCTSPHACAKSASPDGERREDTSMSTEKDRFVVVVLGFAPDARATAEANRLHAERAEKRLWLPPAKSTRKSA